MLTDKNFLKISREIATGSKCVGIQIGAIIVNDNRILSTGYNGTPGGYINCKDFWKGEDSDKHKEWSMKYEIHAEMNALLWAARKGVSVEGATIFCTYQPCFLCTKNIIGTGIKRIVYEKKSEHSDDCTLDRFIRDNGLDVEHIPLN